MAAQLEQILSRLLVPDNAVIQQATQELKAVTKDPAVIPALCTILGSSENPQLRQYAAVLLRRRIMRTRQWKALPADVVQGIRENILQLILQEPEKPVRKAIAQIVGTVAKHELPSPAGWPEFFTFVEQHIKSEDAQQREIGLYVLSVTASVATTQLQPHLQAIITLCAAALDDQANHMVPFYAIRTLTFMVIAVGSDEEPGKQTELTNEGAMSQFPLFGCSVRLSEAPSSKAFQALVPKFLPMIKNLIPVDEELATEAMEILDELVECEVGVIVPHIRTVIEFSIEIGANKTLGDSLRIKALSFLSWLTRLKKKAILKLKLTTPILGALFPIMCEPNDDDDEEDDQFEEAEASTAPSFAAQVVDTMALHLPPERIMPPVLKLVEGAMGSEDPYTRKAGLISLAVVAEGCSDYIRHKHLKALLELVCKSVSDPSQVVRNAALFALGQFSEYFQPDISKYSGELFPLLFDQMNRASQNIDKDPKSVTKIYYALEMCCENLGKDILPYLPTLMQHLLAALSTAVTPHAKELAISAIGATANAAKKEIVPYFGQIIEQLKSFLVPAEDEDQLKVQMQAVETLSVLARTMGEHFQPLSVECLSLGLRLLREASDPDLKRCIYGLLASISTLLKADMQPHLEEIVKEMLASIKSNEGITAHSEDETTEMFKIFDDDAEENEQQELNGMEDEEEDEDINGFSINNAYLGEKEDACISLGELSCTTGAAFVPFLGDCFTEISALVDHPSPEVRKACMTALGQFCCASNEIYKAAGSESSAEVLQGMMATTVPMMLRIVKEDLDRHVAMVTLEAINEMLQKIGAPMLQVVSCDTLMTCVKDVLQLKIASQDPEDSEDGEDDQQAEYDAMLVENAGDILPTVAKIVGGETFAPYMAGMLPELVKKTKSTSVTADKSFSVGTLADCVDAMGVAAGSFAPILYPIFMGMAKDEDEEVRSNACFALGVLASKAGPAMHQHFADIQKLYMELMTPNQNRRVVDNICAGFCRLMWSNIEAVPVDQVLPAIVQCLPLHEDLEENPTVYECLAGLYKNSHPVLLQCLPQILQAIAQVLGTEGIKPELQVLLVQMVQSVSQQNSDMFQTVLKSLPEQQGNNLQQCLVLTNGSS